MQPPSLGPFPRVTAAILITTCGLICARPDARAAPSQSPARPRVQPDDTAVSLPAVQCGNSNLEKSRCMIDLLLQHVTQTYQFPEGGGISAIVAKSPTSYAVNRPGFSRDDFIPRPLS